VKTGIKHHFLVAYIGLKRVKKKVQKGENYGGLVPFF